MIPVKRIEIVIEAAQTSGLLSALRGAGALSYTLVQDVHGDGDRGERAGDELGDVFRNCLVLIACEEAGLEPILKVVQPFLTDTGGICLVSDAHWLRH